MIDWEIIELILAVGFTGLVLWLALSPRFKDIG